MADFAKIIRDNIAGARTILLSLHADVVWKRWTSSDGTGGDNYDAPDVTLKAIVEQKAELVKLPGGQEIEAKTYIGIFEPLAAYALGIEGRQDPIDDRDIFILPDGTTGPILTKDGFIDAGTGRRFYHQLNLGG